MKSNAFLRIAAVVALVLHAGLACAQQRQFNDWTVGLSSSGPFAATAGTGGTLILYQVPGPRYLWILEQTTLTCQDQSTLRVHISTDADAADTEVRCLRDGRPQFLFTDGALVSRMLQHASRVRIDIPTNGAPYSVQFSLNGMPDALSFLQTLAPAPAQPPASNGGIRSFQCQQLWNDYHRCQDDFKMCTVRTHGTGPCPACFTPNCTQ